METKTSGAVKEAPMEEAPMEEARVKEAPVKEAPVKEAPMKEARSARERLLDAADELFYSDGVHTVGIDRVIERAGVAKASLYSAFGSKDELIRAYLTRRFEARRVRISGVLARYDTPREQILALFDNLGKVVALPSYRGCAFMNASAEAAPGTAAAEVTGAARAWTRDLFRGLAEETGAPEHEALARQLALLYDGAMISARLDHDLTSAQTAKEAATLLLDAAGSTP